MGWVLSFTGLTGPTAGPINLDTGVDLGVGSSAQMLEGASVLVLQPPAGRWRVWAV